MSQGIFIGKWQHHPSWPKGGLSHNQTTCNMTQDLMILHDVSCFSSSFLLKQKILTLAHPTSRDPLRQDIDHPRRCRSRTQWGIFRPCLYTMFDYPSTGNPINRAIVLWSCFFGEQTLISNGVMKGKAGWTRSTWRIIMTVHEPYEYHMNHH